MNKVRLRLLLNIYIHKPKCLDITRRQTHRSFTLTVDDRSHVSHKDKQQENHELRFHLNLSNFPDEAQLQLILLRVFAQYFKLSHLTTRITPRLTYFTLMFSDGRKFDISLNLAALAI